MAKPTKHYGGWRIRWIDATGIRKSEVLPSYREAELALSRYQIEAEEVRLGHRKQAPPQKIFGEGHVFRPQWRMGDAGCTGDQALDRRLCRGKNAQNAETGNTVIIRSIQSE